MLPKIFFDTKQGFLVEHLKLILHYRSTLAFWKSGSHKNK